MRVLQVAASDLTVAKLLLPLIDRLQCEGMEVEAACGAGKFATELGRSGYRIHTLPLSRSVAPLASFKGAWALYRLMARERYDIVHVHTPVAAALGRVAAKMAGVESVLYTAHGFYFHDRMSPPVRWGVVQAERLLGLATDMLFTQSHEDALSAVNLGIRPSERVLWIGNGVDLDEFHGAVDGREAKRAFGLSPDTPVVGFVGRLVREKGILDLLEAMRVVGEKMPGATLLIAGDSSTAKDRDSATAAQVRRAAANEGLPYEVVFTGFVDDMATLMRAFDVFVLPSYREGMPRSIIEAMASERPVVATNIRGCREEVVEGDTGLLYEPGDASALAEAIVTVLEDPARARQMGANGRSRAEALFDEQKVLDRQVAAYQRLWRESRVLAGVAPD